MPIPFGVQLGIVGARRDGRATVARGDNRTGRGCRRMDRRMARQLIDPARGNPDIWAEDLQDGSLVRVTTATGSDISRCGLRMGRGWCTDPAASNERRLSIAAADGTGILP